MDSIGLFIAGSFLSIVLSYTAWLFGRFLWWSFMSDKEEFITTFDNRVSGFFHNVNEVFPDRFMEWSPEHWGLLFSICALTALLCAVVWPFVFLVAGLLYCFRDAQRKL